MTTLWPTLTVQDVDASLAFYRDRLGFNVDFSLQDEKGKTYLGSVELGDTVIMFESPDPNQTDHLQRGFNSELSLTICFSDTHDLDALFTDLGRNGVQIECEIANRPWGNRDFTIRDPDGYKLILAKPANQ